MLQRQSGFFPVICINSDWPRGCSYYPHQTGLQQVIIHCPAGRGSPLRSHLKIAALRGGRQLEATVTISDCPNIEEGALPPAVGRRVFRFIRSNRLVLQALWNEAIDCADAAKRFRRS